MPPNRIVPCKVVAPALTTKPRLILPTEPSVQAQSLWDHMICIYGPPGVGKTTAVNDMAPGKILFLSTDRGTRTLDALRVECLSWEAFDQVITALEQGQASNYVAIAIDHVDDWAMMAETYVLNKKNVESLTDLSYGKGWTIYKHTLSRFMERIKRLKLGIIFIAHEEIKTVKVQGRDVDKSMPKMSKQAWNIIIPLVDIVAWCGMRPMNVGGKRAEVRIMTSEPKEDLYAKDRSRRKRPEGRDWEKLSGADFAATFQ